MSDETPISARCPHCDGCMEFKGICYYTAMELYECRRCLELVQVQIPDMLPERNVA